MFARDFLVSSKPFCSGVLTTLRFVILSHTTSKKRSSISFDSSSSGYDFETKFIYFTFTLSGSLPRKRKKAALESRVPDTKYSLFP